MMIGMIVMLMKRTDRREVSPPPPVLMIIIDSRAKRGYCKVVERSEAIVHSRAIGETV